MNRTDRLFAITVLLQKQKRLRAIDLARMFDISERTVYRDILALNEGDIPIISIPGFGYELMEGYVLPPLMFSPTEARSLFLAADLLEARSQGQLAKDLRQALAKLTVALPERVREEGSHFSKAMRVIYSKMRFDLDDPKLSLLFQAIREKRVIWLAYFNYKENSGTEREVEPLELSLAEDNWYLHAFCRLRGANRAFRLNRIQNLRLLHETFKAQQGLSTNLEKQKVTILFGKNIVRWVHERQHYSFESESIYQGEFVMTYAVDDFDEIMPWLLGWGKNAKPLSPPEFKVRVGHELTDMLKSLET